MCGSTVLAEEEQSQIKVEELLETMQKIQLLRRINTFTPENH